MDQKKILLTGANGLIGRAVIKRLFASHKIFAMIRQLPSVPITGQVVPIIQDLSVMQEPAIAEIPDIIIHLAQSPFHRDFPGGARDLFDVNTASTQRLLEWAQKMGVKKFIYASSGGVYGTSPNPMVEDDLTNIGGELDYYMATKRSAELIADAYRTVLDVTILRFFFVYGAYQRDSMLIPRLINRVVSGEPIQLQGQDGMRFNPTFVDDAADAVAAACHLQKSETINIVGPQELTMRDVGEAIGNVVGCSPKFDIQKDIQPKSMIGSPKKMIYLLGRPKITIDDGLQMMMDQGFRTSSLEV